MAIVFVTLILFANSVFATASKKDCFIKPCQIAGDFDGDGKPDTATLISNGKKRGIEIRLADNKIYILGAGQSIHDTDDFSWMDKWSLHKGKISMGASEEAPPTSRGDSLLVEKMESASAILYYDGKKFGWYQQGD